MKQKEIDTWKGNAWPLQSALNPWPVSQVLPTHPAAEAHHSESISNEIQPGEKGWKTPSQKLRFKLCVLKKGLKTSPYQLPFPFFTSLFSSSSPWSFPFFRTFQQHPRLNCPPHLSDIFIQRFDVRSMASLGQLQLCCRDVLPAVCVPQKHRKIGRTKTSGKGGTMHNIVDIINVKSETSLKQIFSKLVWIKQKCWSLCYSQLFPNQP